jgi:MFS transporter, BCD family, chlorophyll transporter
MSWFAIVRLGGVQAAIGAMVMLCTSLLNRVMVVEYAMAAAIPAGLVAWHYAVQLSRPVWGHGSDKGRRRTPWIIGGMAVLASGAMLAVYATVGQSMALAVMAFTLIGGGVGAAGTSLLAVLATQTRPDQRAAAAAITWIMMIVGIIVTAGVAGQMLKPFSVERLVMVVCVVAAAAFVLAVVSVWGVEKNARAEPARASVDFRTAVSEMLADREARVFTVFVFVSMLAYAMQDMILEPFAGLMFAMTPAESTTLSGVQHMGVLSGGRAGCPAMADCRQCCAARVLQWCVRSLGNWCDDGARGRGRRSARGCSYGCMGCIAGNCIRARRLDRRGRR